MAQTGDDLREAMAELKAGREAAVQRVYRLTGARVYGKLLALLKQPDLAQSAFISTYLRLWKERGAIPATIADPFHFIACLAHRSALEIRFRTKGGGSVFMDGADRQGETRGHIAGISLHTLNETDQEMLTAAYLQFESVEEIAKRVGLPRDEVRTRLTALTGPGGVNND